MARLSLSVAWDQTASIIRRDGRLFGSVALALMVLPQTVLGILMPASIEAISLGLAVLALVVLLIGFAAQIAFNRLALASSITVGSAINRGLARLPAFVGALLIIAVVTTLLFVALLAVLMAAGAITPPSAGANPPASVLVLILILAALIFAIFQLMAPIAAAEAGGSIHLLRRSWGLAKSEYPRLLVFVCMVLLGLLVVLAAGQFVVGSTVVLVLGQPRPLSFSALVLSLIVGALQAAYTVVTSVMLARIYVQLAGRADAKASVPSSGI